METSWIEILLGVGDVIVTSLVSKGDNISKVEILSRVELEITS